MDPLSILAALAIVVPAAAGVFGLYARQVKKSREAIFDRHAAELAIKDQVLAAKDMAIAERGAEVSYLNGQVQALNTRLQIAHDVHAAYEKLRQLPPPEKRADPSLSNKVYDMIPLGRVVDFYDQVAPFYNRRNTGKYLETYIEIYRAVLSNAAEIEGAVFCDLGGGTGFLLNRFQHHAVQWLNVDISREALRIFENDFVSYDRKQIRNLDVGRDSFTKRGETFDVVVMSYLWSSMDAIPDFAQIRDSMHDKSILIVADNHPTYVDQNRYYGFDDIQGKNIAIAPRPMIPTEVRALIVSKGFTEVDYKEVTIDGKPYSQLHVYRRGA